MADGPHHTVREPWNDLKVFQPLEAGKIERLSSEEDAIYPPNATGFNLQMAKQRTMANVTHAR
jgi:hypothetical protein